MFDLSTTLDGCAVGDTVRACCVLRGYACRLHTEQRHAFHPGGEAAARAKFPRPLPPCPRLRGQVRVEVLRGVEQAQPQRLGFDATLEEERA
jgi:hypothetical protein